MPKNTHKEKCPECGEQASADYCPPYQEYPGASVQGGYTYINCEHCGLEDTINADLSDFNYSENTRGW